MPCIAAYWPDRQTLLPVAYSSVPQRCSRYCWWDACAGCATRHMAAAEKRRINRCHFMSKPTCREAKFPFTEPELPLSGGKRSVPMQRGAWRCVGRVYRATELACGRSEGAGWL